MTNKLPSRSLRVLDKLVWFICTARNAIVVIVCLIMAMVMDPEVPVTMINIFMF